MQFERNPITGPNLFFNDELESIMEKYAVKSNFPAKTVLYEPCNVIDAIFYIKSGRTKHYVINEDGSEKMLYTLSPGWFFGECAVLLDQETCVYSATEIPSQIYKISRDNFNMLIDENKHFRNAVLRCCVQKVLILTYEVENLSFNSCKDRLKRLFGSFVDKDNIEEAGWYNIKISYTHYDLGVIIGATRVTVSKLVHELCEENYIRIVNRKTQVNIAEYKRYMGSNSD